MTADALLLLAANSLVPTGWEAVASGAGLLTLALLVWALVEIFRCPGLASGWKLVLGLLAFTLPFFGPLIAVVMARSHRRRVLSGELALTAMAPPAR
ncbi:hypothetical protein [Nesterenkonia xinjiangensis]|uniref:Phospholipase D-like protein n=1 Tax=Nesterenkonia xinjiangensis TaxID=225327 RepID=A0A7Z0GMW0_9MICC|nr:hypothetical protein [Nesterenkonia xinjiangensis]NYJ78820.1 hypothetical protein [Nesterenkonia xinjiangensis]